MIVDGREKQLIPNLSELSGCLNATFLVELNPVCAYESSTLGVFGK